MLLKKGKTGPYVQDLQEHLNGIYPELELVADGDFGPATEKAVIKFQQDNGLGADGIVGPATWDESYFTFDVQNKTHVITIK